MINMSQACESDAKQQATQPVIPAKVQRARDKIQNTRVPVNHPGLFENDWRQSDPKSFEIYVRNTKQQCEKFIRDKFLIINMIRKQKAQRACIRRSARSVTSVSPRHTERGPRVRTQSV